MTPKDIELTGQAARFHVAVDLFKHIVPMCDAITGTEERLRVATLFAAECANELWKGTSMTIQAGDKP